MSDKRFDKELQMIRGALEDEAGETQLREYICPYLERVVDEYMRNEAAELSERDVLIRAGWTHFPLAIKKYKERAEQLVPGEKEVFYFTSYFDWYIRQGILEYLRDA